VREKIEALRRKLSQGWYTLPGNEFDARQAHADLLDALIAGSVAAREFMDAEKLDRRAMES
jgi:hypothetical protein